MCVHAGVYVSVSEIWESRMSAHLKALGADFLAFLHPGDSGFGLPGGLAHKRCNPPWDACLVLWGFDETWQAWESRSKRGRGRCKVIRNERGRGNGGQRGGGGMKVMLVPVTSACKTYLSMGITFSTQKATMRKNPHWYCCCAHLQLSHGRNILSLCACLSLYHVEFLTPALTHCLKESKVCRQQTMKLQL